MPGGRTSNQDAQGSVLTTKKGFCPLLSPLIVLNQVKHPSRELASPIDFSLCLDQLSKINHVHMVLQSKSHCIFVTPNY